MENNSVYKMPFKERLCLVGENVLDEFLKIQALQRYVNRYKPIIVSLTMGLFILKFGNINLLIVILLSIFLYILILQIILGIDREDIELLEQIKSSKG